MTLASGRRCLPVTEKLWLAQMVGTGFIPPFVFRSMNHEHDMTFGNQNSNQRMMLEYYFRPINPASFFRIYLQDDLASSL